MQKSNYTVVGQEETRTPCKCRATMATAHKVLQMIREFIYKLVNSIYGK